ncbi:MAG: hypothetical protein ACI9UV_001765 [Algoriphagus sp.]|jgi:hypothetical protein
MFFGLALMASNVLLHVTIALFVLYGIHSATVAVIFKLFELTPFYLNIQAVLSPFYLIKSSGRNWWIFLYPNLYPHRPLFEFFRSLSS